MSELVLVILVGAVGAYAIALAYENGKRTGSRKGYGVGYARGSRRRGGSDCFVATAVFVRPGHPALRQLRGFRDYWLRRSRAGRGLIWLYYRVGPTLAAGVRRLPLVRRGLRPVLLGWCWRNRRWIRDLVDQQGEQR